MTRSLVAALLLTALFASSPATAVIGTLDDVPAATLLLPYFEVDPTTSTGVNTLFTVRNADSRPVVAHVTLWSNYAVPVLNFEIYLTGYDEQSVDLRDVLILGILPTTGPSNALSPRGAHADPHDSFGGSCSTTIGRPPAYSNPAIGAALRQHAQSWLTGHASPLFGTCAGALTEHMEGYVTIDATRRCTLLSPSDPGYFAAGGMGEASNRNVLWGDWSLVDANAHTVHSGTLVALEASATDPLSSTPGSPTFYYRYTFGTSADNRESLSGLWTTPLGSLAGVGESLELLVWRDSGRPITAFQCNQTPNVFPLGADEMMSLDAEGVPTLLPLDLFPRETQRIALADPGRSLRMDLAPSFGIDPGQQAHVTVLRRSPGPVVGGSTLNTTAGAVQPAGTGAIATTDAAPGASLLLPYFEVDPGAPNGARTSFSVHNASPDPVLTRVVPWTDLAVPTLGFEIYLPGFGSRNVDLREMLTTGILPSSGPSPLPGCGGVLPPAPLPADTVSALVAAHRGAPSMLFGGLCGGSSPGDAKARGYVTVDVVTRCTSALPGQAGYFGPGGAVSFDNVLWGDWALVEPATSRAHGGSLVTVQASLTDPRTSQDGQPTFYGRYLAWNATDHREALTASWGSPSRRDPAQPGSASLLAWRDSGILGQPFVCGFPPGALIQGASRHYNASGQDSTVPTTVFGLQSQIRTADWTGPDFGALVLDLRPSLATGPPFPQAFVTALESRPDLLLWRTFPGTQLPATVAFSDGFESGSVGAWSGATP